MKLFPACPDGNRGRFFLHYTIFCKQEIDYYQTNNLDNCPIYTKGMQLKYQESLYMSHQMFDHLSHIYFSDIVFKHP